MAQQGPNNGNDFSTVDADGPDWDTPGFAKFSDNNYAITIIGPLTNPGSNFLKALNFGFSIPAGATINGIQVDVERRVSLGTFAGQDQAAYLCKNADDFAGSNLGQGIAWPTTDTYTTYGGATQLWGRSWTAADINSANFGFEIQAQNPNFDIGDETFYIDHIRVTVYYTLPTGGPVRRMVRLANSPRLTVQRVRH